MPEPTFLFNTFYSNVLYFNLLFHLTLLNLICGCLLSLPCSGNIFHQTRPYTSYYIKHAELPFSFLFHSNFPQCVFFVKEDLCICALCCIYKCITEEVEWTGFAVSYLVSARGFSYEWLTNCFLKSIQGRFFFQVCSQCRFFVDKSHTSCCHQTASDSRRCFSSCHSETINYFENGNMNSCFSISASFFLQKHFSQIASLSLNVFENRKMCIFIL